MPPGLATLALNRGATRHADGASERPAGRSRGHPGGRSAHRPDRRAGRRHQEERGIHARRPAQRQQGGGPGQRPAHPPVVGAPRQQEGRQRRRRPEGRDRARHLGRAGAEVGRLTVSVGAAAFPSAADDLDGLVAAADSALLEAKRAGRDRVRVAD